MPVLDDAGCRLLFTEARTHNHFKSEPIADSVLRALYELMKFPPTSANCSQARLLFLRTPSAKERLRPALSAGNLEKTMSAPVTTIIAYDLQFYERLPELFPQADARAWFAGNDAVIQTTAFRNSSLQGAYFLLAARAVGARYRADVGFRQCQGRCRVLSRRHAEIEFSLQSRLWQRREAFPAQSAAELRGSLPDPVAARRRAVRRIWQGRQGRCIIRSNARRTQP